MKYVFYECDDCGHGARPGLNNIHARAFALEDGFGFIKGKCLCKHCLKKLTSEQQAKAKQDLKVFQE